MYHEIVTDDRADRQGLSSPETELGRRPYRQRARAERQAATRRRIADAAVELHGTVGPARTTISAVADLAGVERLTVYRHFPDERSLFTACSSRFLEQHPPPDLSGPMRIARPGPRTEAVLLTLYRYYSETRQAMASLLRDEPVVPLVAEYLAPYHAMLAGVADALAADASPRRRRTARAAAGHALAFETWQSLTIAQAQTDAEAAALMARFVTMVSRPGHRASSP